jgi:2-polyprenyl-3-methyl-5-hydroxy-6-metoxy-1,4-benzoquinol methylase
MIQKGSSYAARYPREGAASTRVVEGGLRTGEQLYQDGRYLELNPTWHAEDSPWKARQVFEMIRRNDLQANSICEIGCGAGEVLNQLHLLLPGPVSFTGFEISPQAFQLCQAKEKERLHFHLDDLLLLDEAYFDIVLAIDVFEHVEDYFGFLRRLRKKGQFKIFHIPLELSVQTVFRGSPILRQRRSLGHIHYFTKETALAGLIDTGYEILDHFYTSHCIDLPAKSLKNSFARIPRKIAYQLHRDLAVRMLGGFSLMVLAQ